MLDLVTVFEDFRFLFADTELPQKGVQDFVEFGTDMLLVPRYVAHRLPSGDKVPDGGQVLLALALQLEIPQLIENTQLGFQVLPLFSKSAVLAGMQAVKILVAGFLEFFPDLIRVFSGNMANLLPLLLNSLHLRGCSFPVFAVFEFQSAIQKGLFLIQVVLLLFFQVLVKGILTPVKGPDRTFEGCPRGFIILLWHLSGLEELLPQCLDLSDLFLYLPVGFGHALSLFIDLSDDLLLFFQIGLVLFILILEVFLTALVDLFGRLTETLPNRFPLLLGHRSDLLLPYFVKHL